METPPPPPPPPFTPAATEPRRSWWSRNWKWFVPTGCATVIVLGIGFICVVAFFAFGLMKSTDAYKTAVERAKADERVVAALGTPIEQGFWVSGHSQVDGSSGSADFSIPLSGPKGKGTVYVVATKSAGDWKYEKLFVEIDQTKQRINLAETSDED